MPEADFERRRDATFDRVILSLDQRIHAASPSLLLHLQEMSPERLRVDAKREAWSLLLQGVRHLKSGAPGNRPGSMTEALSRASLRSSALAAALGVRPPQFEQIYFSVDYTSGEEAALFLCNRLIEAAEGDMAKSRQLIQQKILAEKPAEALKKQMALSFDVLAKMYAEACGELKTELENTVPQDSL